jgi:hypothetical protein
VLCLRQIYSEAQGGMSFLNSTLLLHGTQVDGAIAGLSIFGEFARCICFFSLMRALLASAASVTAHLCVSRVLRAPAMPAASLG